MPDKTIFGFSVEAYAEMIDVLNPDYYLTPDGETYLGECDLSSHEIRRVVSDTLYLAVSCPDSEPIGLVKGCTLQQVEGHTIHLLNLGLSRFVFHAGDYLCRGPSCVTYQAIAFAQAIRKHVPWLAIQGIGALKSLRNFGFADGFITQSHFVNAFYGRFSKKDRRAYDDDKVSREDIMNNLRHIKQNISAIESQSTLFRWLFPDRSEPSYEQESTLVKSMNSMRFKGGI
jgi:hypothetical protein